MTESELDDLLSTPRAETKAALDACPGSVIILGAGGKMGPTLARMVRRASPDDRRVIAVSRWSSKTAERALNDAGVETITCDLLDRDAVGSLPDAPNVIFMAGQKFGTTGAPAMTWGMNTLVPANCAERYRESRIVAFSTGNVYALTPAAAGGSRETDAPSPVGEYAASCLGRERVFELYAERHATRVALVRLNYAIDLRYGVLVDIAQKVFAGEPIDLASGNFNCIWQGDANEMILRALDLASSPMVAWNLCRPEIFSTREAALRLGELLERKPEFVGTESATALLGNAKKICSELGEPRTNVETMMRLIADWVKRGGRSLGKPTHFETRDGKY